MKKAIYSAVTSLLALPALVRAGDAGAGAGAGKYIPDVDLPEGDGTGVLGIARKIMKWLLTLVGIIAIIAFVIAGILYLTAAGDEDQIGRAKKAMINSIIGVIVALLGLIVLKAVDNMLRAKDEW